MMKSELTVAVLALTFACAASAAVPPECKNLSGPAYTDCIQDQPDWRAAIKHPDTSSHCGHSGGISIGMSKEQVLCSVWGKPSSINKTTTVHGVHEQWVYDRFHNGYLYFENDVLTAIQN
jgi:hypothetical protein